MPDITEQDVLSALKSCYDPEIPVNIVDLGLIYKMNFTPANSDAATTDSGTLSRASRTSPLT